MNDTYTRILNSVSKTRKQGAKTKADIAARLGISYTLTSTLVNDLVAEGKLSQSGRIETGRQGRPAITYRAV